jgi:type I restriction enzyme, S subunit
VSTIDTEGLTRGSLGELLPIKYGKSLPAAIRDGSGSVPVFGSSGVVGHHSTALTNGPTIIVGRKGNVGAVHYSTVPCWPIDTAYFVEPPVGHSPAYYRYLLSSLNLVRLDKSTAIPGLSRDDYNAVKVAVHAPARQVEVVAEIEKQFSRLDEAVANLQRVKANLKRYKASILKAAVEGRLVETEASLARREGRTYETGEQLLQRILEERRAKWALKKKYVEPATAERCLIESVAEGWTEATVEQMSQLVEYGSSSKTSDESTGVPVLRMGNIFEGELQFDDLKYLPSDHDEFPKLLLKDSDLLFNRTNSPELVGKIAVFRSKPTNYSFASYLIRVRTLAGALPEFLAAYINSRFGREWVKSVVTQQVGQANVNGTKLQALSVPLPPLAEQSRIVAELDRHLTIIREVEAEVDANLKRAQALRQATLAKAFHSLKGENNESN